MRLEDRFKGCLLGLAIGDALGYPVEFMNRDDIRRAYGPEGVTDFVDGKWHPKGTYSDDTQMTIAVAKALLATRSADLDDLMPHIKAEFIAWSKSPENDRAPGPTCIDGCRQLESGTHWFSSGDPWSKGCGAAMRAAPVGLMFTKDARRLVEVSRAVAICTHAHPTALASSIAAAAAVAAALEDIAEDQIVDHILGVLNRERGAEPYIERESHDPLQEQTRLLQKLVKVLTLGPDRAFDEIGGGWIGEEAVAGALYCYLRTPSDFRATVLTAANASMSDPHAKGKGRCDSDSIACIAGAISGAALGIQAIPENWIRGVENHDLLFDLGRQLAERHALWRSHGSDSE